MRWRRKRREASTEAAVAVSPSEMAQPDAATTSALRIVVVGERGPTRDALETAVDAQADMDLVGSFDDLDSGTSGIRANTRRSGVVVLVDAGTLEATGAMTGIRHLRDRFPFCRFLAYGEGFDEDAASALLFFGADAVVGVSEGAAAVARVIRRGARPGEEGELEAEEEWPDEAPDVAAEPEPPAPSRPPLETPSEDVAAREEMPPSQPEPEPERERELKHDLDHPQPPEDPSPQPDPATAPTDEDGDELPPAPRPGQGTVEEIWRGSPPTEHRPPPRRITPNDVWDRRASEVRFDSPSEADSVDPRTP